MREERRILRYVTYGALARRNIDPAGRREECASPDLNLARLDVTKARDRFQQSRLAGARGSENRRYSRVEGKIDLSANVESGIRHRSSIVLCLYFRSREPLRERDRDEGQDDCDAEKRQSFMILAELDKTINRQRQCLRPSWNIAGNHNRGAEFAERPGVREQTSGDDAAPCKRQRHREKYSRTSRAECRGDLLQTRIDLDERAPRRTYEKRKRHDGHRDKHALGVEHHFDAAVIKPRTDWTSASENLQENETCCNRRHDQRQHHNRLHEGLPSPVFARQHPCDRNPDRQDQKSARQRDGERKQRYLPDFSRHHVSASAMALQHYSEIFEFSGFVT